jgi:hypothetical protein
MKREAVVGSSNVASVGYDRDHEVAEVEFLGSGSVYHYAGVTEAEWEERLQWESIGRWVANRLKIGHEVFRGEFVSEGEEAERSEDEAGEEE